MKKILQLCFLLSCCTLFGQDDSRYCNEVFESVITTQDIQYGINIDVLKGAPDALLMDIYEPEGDDSESRPVVIMTHTGTFFPPGQNGGTTGVKTDSALVQIAKNLTRRGFVVASINYRLGWVPIAPIREIRVNTLINAAYRGLQDFRTAVRFLKKNQDVYRIDPDRIASFGVGTGGYISYAVATLDNIEKTYIEKFITIDSLGNPIPMVKIEESGNVDGLGYPNEGDTTVLNIPNHVGYSSEVQFCFAAGGAVADTSWIDNNSIPMAAAHVIDDPNAPFLSAVLTEPVNGEAIVEVQGPGWAIPYFNNKGANDILNSIDNYDDEYSLAAIDKVNALIDNDTIGEYSQMAGQRHVFPLKYNYALSGPWEYWEPAIWTQVPCVIGEDPAECNMHDDVALPGHPDMSKQLGLTYVDTLVEYFIPRAIIALDLNNDCSVGLDELSVINASISPNPSASDFNINVPEEIIQSIRVYDMNGALVKEIRGINDNQYVLKGEEFSTGIYILNINTKDNSVGQKIVVE